MGLNFLPLGKNTMVWWGEEGRGGLPSFETMTLIAGYNDEKATRREMARRVGLEEAQLV